MKYIALLAILPIFAAIIMVNNIGTSDAAIAQGSPGTVAPGSFGSATAGIVCGDRLCSDSTPVAPMPIAITIIEDEMPDYMPSLGFKSLSKFVSDSPNTYVVEFTVTAAEKNLENIKIICTTDVETIETTVARLPALTTTTNVVRILAMDPASVTGEIISFQIAPAGADFIAFEKLKELATVPEQPTAELSLAQIFEPTESTTAQITPKGFVPGSPEDEATTYKVVYRVSNAVDSNVRDVMILVSSDIETVVGELQGDLEIKRSAISVLIKAFDPASITAEIIGFDIR